MAKLWSPSLLLGCRAEPTASHPSDLPFTLDDRGAASCPPHTFAPSIHQTADGPKAVTRCARRTAQLQSFKRHKIHCGCTSQLKCLPDISSPACCARCGRDIHPIACESVKSDIAVPGFGTRSFTVVAFFWPSVHNPRRAHAHTHRHIDR